MTPKPDRERVHEATQAIITAFADAEIALLELSQQAAQHIACQTLADARALPAGKLPMWPHMPLRFAMEAKNGGEARYLYIYWHKLPDGTYQGPAGQHKTYIGVDPADQVLARLMAKNLADWSRIDQARETMRGALKYRIADLERLAREWRATATRVQCKAANKWVQP